MLTGPNRVVKGLGYGNIETLLLTAPPYVSPLPTNVRIEADERKLIGVGAILLNGWHADRTRERYLHVVIPPLIAVVAFIIAATTTKFAPRYL